MHCQGLAERGSCEEAERLYVMALAHAYGVVEQLLGAGKIAGDGQFELGALVGDFGLENGVVAALEGTKPLGRGGRLFEAPEQAQGAEACQQGVDSSGAGVRWIAEDETRPPERIFRVAMVGGEPGQQRPEERPAAERCGTDGFKGAPEQREGALDDQLRAVGFEQLGEVALTRSRPGEFDGLGQVAGSNHRLEHAFDRRVVPLGVRALEVRDDELAEHGAEAEFSRREVLAEEVVG